MKKLILSFIIGVSTALSGHAIPAYPYANKVTQPDGSTLTIRLVGDEFLHYSTTDDGYTIVKNSDGFYVYATEDNGKLVATSHIAQDAAVRSESAKRFLSGISRGVRPAMTTASKSLLSASRSAGAKLKLHGNGKYDISNFRGLIILVEYNDKSFSRSDISTIFNDMVNKKNYDGYMTDALLPEKMEYTGSVRDYYYDNTMGNFDPQFDIVGPVKINYSVYDPESSTNARALTAAACRAADALVDFSKYDRDGDGTADMVYFIFAGYGANFSGNDSRLLWPHASTMIGVRLDGVTLSRYACSTEMYGREGSNFIDGIGTICHEFSHVLGLPDEYDTDYKSSGGQSNHPATWSIMAGGSYRNKSRTPVGYTLYERYALGFASPKLITASGDFKLSAVNTSNDGYRINSAINNEFFLIENRQRTGWDEYLNGHGMTIMRVDSTNVDIWENNKINCDPAHNYLELIRATPQMSGTSVTDSQGDPFPGSGNVTEINNETSPSLRSWTGTATPLCIKDIAENSDGTVSFSVATANVNSLKEDFEAMAVTDGTDATATGKFCDWTFTKKAAVVEPQEGFGKGMRVVSLVKKSEVATSAIDKKVSAISFYAYNTSSSMAIIRCYYSTDGGSSWTVMKNVDGVENYTVAAGAAIQTFYNINVEKPCFKITQYTGSSSVPCYIDDMTISYEQSSAVNTILADSNVKLTANCGADGYLSVSTDAESPVKIYNISGMLIATITPEGGVATVQLPAPGFYIVSQQGKSAKVAY